MVLKYVVKFLLTNIEKTLEFIDFRQYFLKLIDEPKLARKLIFSLIGKGKFLQNLMAEAFFLDFKKNENIEIFDYFLSLFDFILQNFESCYGVLFVLTNLFSAIRQKTEFQKKLN